MSVLEPVRTLAQYNDALHRRLWESIMQLTDEQFVAEIDYSHGSIRNQMVHLAAVDARWLGGLRELPDARAFRLEPADYPTRQSVYEVWDPIAREFMAYVLSLDEASLLRTPVGMPGPAWQVLLHVFNHGTDHRAQILRALHDLGAPTFAQDLGLHLWR